MNFYAILVNGTLSTVAHLSESDGAILREWVEEQHNRYLTNVQVVEMHSLHTDLVRTQAAVESDIESWQP